MQSEAAVVSVTFLFKSLDLQSWVSRSRCAELLWSFQQFLVSVLTTASLSVPAHYSLQLQFCVQVHLMMRGCTPAAFDEDYHKNHSQLQFYQFGPDRVRNMILKGHTLSARKLLYLPFLAWKLQSADDESYKSSR